MLAIYSIGILSKFIAIMLCTLYIANIYFLCYNKIERWGDMGDKYTEAQKNASIKYLKEKTDSIQIRTPKGTKERWRQAATTRGISLNQFIVDTMNHEIERDTEGGKME